MRVQIKEAFLTNNDTCLGERDGENITFCELYRRFGRFNSFPKFGHKLESEAKWKEIRAFAFAVSLLGSMVFPQGGNGTIHPRVVTVTHALFFGMEYNSKKVFHNLAHMIVADIYRALGRCQVKNHFFQGCNLILQWWMVMHLVKNPRTAQPDHKTRRNLLESHNIWLFLHKFKRESSHEFWFKTLGQ